MTDSGTTESGTTDSGAAALELDDVHASLRRLPCAVRGVVRGADRRRVRAARPERRGEDDRCSRRVRTDPAHLREGSGRGRRRDRPARVAIRSARGRACGRRAFGLRVALRGGEPAACRFDARSERLVSPMRCSARTTSSRGWENAGVRKRARCRAVSSACSRSRGCWPIRRPCSSPTSCRSVWPR